MNRLFKQPHRSTAQGDTENQQTTTVNHETEVSTGEF